MELRDAQEIIETVKIKLRRGADYERCKKEAAPAIARLNEAGAEIAKKHGRRFNKLTFTYLMR